MRRARQQTAPVGRHVRDRRHSAEPAGPVLISKRFGKLVGIWNSTERWPDFTNIRAKPFSPLTDSRFHGAAWLSLPTRRWRQRKNSVAKWSSKSRHGQPGVLELAGALLGKRRMKCARRQSGCCR